MEELATLCREFELSLIVDEVFLDYGLGQESSSFAEGIDGVPVFVVSGLSKIAGLPQMKAAWIVVTGPERAAALDRLEVIADTFLSMNAPVQWALPSWLAGREAIQRQIPIAHRGQSRRTRSPSLEGMPAVNRLEVEGGWYTILRIPAVRSDEETVMRLLDAGVWVHPGHFFGLPPLGWLVVSLLGPEREFSTGVTVLLESLGMNQ